MVIDTGTCAAAGSLEKSRTTVGSGSANGTSTVPVVDSPFRTESGLIESAPMVPAAIADAGTRERAPASTHIRSPRPRAAHPRDVVLPCLRAAERYIPPRPVVVGAEQPMLHRLAGPGQMYEGARTRELREDRVARAPQAYPDGAEDSCTKTLCSVVLG